MPEPHDLDPTIGIPSIPPDPVDAGLAAGFGRPADGPGSALSELRESLGPLRPVLLREAEGESAHVVKPMSDAMPAPHEAGTRYQLAGEIARGGMGAVLRGRDVDLGRDLAVKVLLEKFADRPDVVRRFVEEAQIGGQLQHPGVVPVYDIGRFGDRPFFTMKLVKGKTLAALLAERQKAEGRRMNEVEGGSGRSDASFCLQPSAFLLSIALKVTQAMAYAHAKGVIHRDLKPANIMVGGFGEVQVMDWGLAKVLAEGGIADEERQSRERERAQDVTQIRTARSGSAGSAMDTQAGSLLGTPAYMPPEQANGDVALLDRRADVFGLGAILCEILTGHPPYVGRSAEEVCRKAANTDLADAHARLAACAADAELIALTRVCLSPEAIDRPNDAQAVADALRSYLDGVQLRLRQAELAEAQARAKAVEEAKRRHMTLALAATVLLAIAFGGAGWLWVKNERDTRQAQVTRDVNDALNKATALRERSKAETVGSAALFAQAREQAQRSLALVEAGPAAAALADQVKQLQTELDDESKDRTLVAALDDARLAQAETRADQNRFAIGNAVPKFREAFAAYGLPAGQGEATVAAERIRNCPAPVRDAILAALDEWDDLAGNPDLQIIEPHREWLRVVLAAAEPDKEWMQRFRAARDGKDQEKRRAALEDLAAAKDVTNQPARTLTSLAARLVSVEAHASAAKLLRRAWDRYPADFWVNHNLGGVLLEVRPHEPEAAVRFMTTAVALRPDSPRVHNNLGGVLLRKMGHVDEAIASYRKAIELNPNLAGSHSNLGLGLSRKGQVDEAIACYRKAIELDPTFALAHNNLGAALCDFKKDYDGAIQCFQKALELQPNLATVHLSLAVALRHKGELDQALASCRKAIEIDQRNAVFHFMRGNLLTDIGKVDAAIASYRKGIELDPTEWKAYQKLGLAMYAKGDLDDATHYFRKVIELNPKSAMDHSNLGDTLRRKGQIDEAIACYRKAIELDQRSAITHNHLGATLCDIKRDYDAAIISFREAIELDPKYAEAHHNLGVALFRKGQLDNAIACFRKAIEIDPKYTVAQGSLRVAERMRQLLCRCEDVLAGKDKPKSPAEACELATLCGQPFLKRYAAAVRLFEGVFAEDAKLAANLAQAHRYNAACFAVLAAAGVGEDASKLDAAERSRLRQQALAWLCADLSAWTKLLVTGPAATRTQVQQQMRHWQQDSDLAGIRDRASLANLGDEERTGFTQLWSDVAILLKQAEKP
jgi:serine/threonine-protein kinase